MKKASWRGVFFIKEEKGKTKIRRIPIGDFEKMEGRYETAM